MKYITEDLPQSVESANTKNSLNSYFPVRTNDRVGAFDWDAVVGFAIKLIYRIDLSIDSVDVFKSKCKEVFASKIDEEKFVQHFERMYFEGNSLYKISPELLLFKAKKVKGNTPNSRLGEMFASILQDFYLKNGCERKYNFLERVIVEVFKDHLVSTEKKVNTQKKELPYLPFLSKSFCKDLIFLNKYPNYFLDIFAQFLRIYGYLYTAQLALNIGSWREGEPIPKPLYFILDTETASSERIHIRDDGHHRVQKSLFKIFPYLSMSESLQPIEQAKVPIWAISKSLEESDCKILINYAKAFKQQRILDSNIPETDDPLIALECLLTLGSEQFSKGQSKYGINKRYVDTIESEICNHFIQSKGRSGKVLVINQDYLLLLTNISIGEEEKVRFHELLEAFKERGVFFDKRSEEALIQFYERIGNVERMNDSGDAVYVRKTI